MSSGRIRIGIIINSSPDSDQALSKLVVAALQQHSSVPTLIKILRDADAVALGDRHPAAYGLKVNLYVVKFIMNAVGITTAILLL